MGVNRRIAVHVCVCVRGIQNEGFRYSGSKDGNRSVGLVLPTCSSSVTAPSSSWKAAWDFIWKREPEEKEKEKGRGHFACFDAHVSHFQLSLSSTLTGIQ